MTLNTGDEVPFASLISSNYKTGLDDQSSWLSKIKSNGRREYEKLGWPTAAMESWKYTNLNALAKGQFQAASTGKSVKIPEDQIMPVDTQKIVLVNGVLERSLSNLRDIPDGISIRNLEDIDDRQKMMFEGLDEATAPSEGLPLEALNSATLVDAVFIEIEAGHKAKQPLHIVSIGLGTRVSFAPRIFISAGEGSSVDIIESHTGVKKSSYFTNCVTKMSLADRASIGHYKLQNETENSSHIALTSVNIKEGANYDSFVLNVGALLSRNEIRALLHGRDIDCCVNGAYLAVGDQHVDNTTFIEHAAESSSSREVYKGVLAGKARGVFQGKIFVHPEAQKTDGYQMNRAMLLSSTAEVDSKPELEIYADDVKCSHGATVGELEDDHLFYLTARGIDVQTARRLLVEGYIDEVVGEVKAPIVAEAIKRLAGLWLKENLFVSLP